MNGPLQPPAPEGVTRCQLDLGLEETTPDSAAVDPEEVRRELLAVLDVAEAARHAPPWDRRTHDYHKVVFPQMATWLPADEARQLCQRFALAIERLDRLFAAVEPPAIAVCGLCERAAADPVTASCSRPGCPLAMWEAA